MSSFDSSEDRLTDKSDWDWRYGSQAAQDTPARSRLPEKYFGSYSEIRFWSLLGKHVAPQPGESVLEIGCAPGRVLKSFATRFGCIPHGVEFSKPGFDLTCENFQRWGYPAENVIHADLFDSTFQASVAGKFDIVISGGFIEHFTDCRSVIAAHLAPLRPGGALIVTIPNYRGLNYWLGQRTLPDLLPLHNFDIMNIAGFRDLFPPAQVETRWSGYFGGFDFGMFDTGAPGRLPVIGRGIQTMLNFGFRMVPPPELSSTSPYLLFTGRKISG